MSNTKKNLGHVTAYAYYKAGGGTMTEEEFTEYMADFGDAAERAVDAATSAAQSKTDAQTAAATATDKADIATTAATSASGSATRASSSATTATNAASTATNAATTATNAKNDAVSAKTVAQTAKTAAETAATTATTKAGEASTSATNAAASAQSVASSAAQITQNAEDIDALKEDLSQIEERTNNLFDKSDYEDILAFDLTGTVQAATGAKSVIIPVNVTTETSVTAHRATIASRFALSAYTAKPVVGATSKYHDYNNSASSITITVDSTIKYLMVYLWRPDDSPITMEQMTDGLMVQFGSAYTGYEPYYVPKIADRQIASEKLSNDVNEQLTSGEIQDIIFDSSFNLWNTSLLEVMENTRCSGYNTTTCEITTAVADNYATAIMDIPQNINKLKIKKPATIPSGGQMYVAISSTLRTATNRPFSALSASFRDQVAEYTLGDAYYVLDLAEMRNRGFEKLAISTYSESAMYVQADKITSDWLVCDPDIYCPIGAFGSIGAIGDSYTAGSIVKADNTWMDMPNQSYIAVMGKRAGVSWSNYGMGGTNTRTYITNKLPAVLSADANDFYFLALGINDSSLGLDYIGSISDIHDADYTQNADTFYGNYGKIIAQVKAHAPNARFCMIKTPIYLAIWKELDTAIQAIADHYGFACIDPKDDPYFHSKTFYSRVSNHPSCIGYAGMALAYERLLSKAIEKNPLYFFYANIDANIPTAVS